MVLKSKKDQLICSSFSGLSPTVTLEICHSPKPNSRGPRKEVTVQGTGRATHHSSHSAKQPPGARRPWEDYAEYSLSEHPGLEERRLPWKQHLVYSLEF